MLGLTPVPLQAIIWPLLGAAIILLASRLLPNWLRRVVALAASLASIAALWSLRGGGVERVELSWAPLNLFRMSPAFSADGLAILTAITLGWFTAAAVLGIRGRTPSRTTWHGLLLIAVAGCLTMSMAANLLTLALGSALLDLALIAMAVTSADGVRRVDRFTWRMVVPGVASTIVIVIAALRLDTEFGHASLTAQSYSEGALILLGIAGVLRIMIYPLVPRGLGRPQSAATWILPAGVGMYLLTRVQGLIPVLMNQSWMLALGGIALVVGGLLAWSASKTSQEKPGAEPGFARLWAGSAVHQTGFGLAFVVLLAAAAPWPLLNLTLALGTLAIWWEGGFAGDDESLSARPDWIQKATRSLTGRATAFVAARTSPLDRWRESALGRHRRAILPTIALASLAGLPLTVGAVGRWSFYASMLHGGKAILLLGSLLADAFLIAGLWSAFHLVLKRSDSRRHTLASGVSMVGLVVPLILFGVAPGSLVGGLGVETMERFDVSVWGLGLIFVLSWLVGSWLVYVQGRVDSYFVPLQRFLGLDWFYRALDWLGKRFASAVYWMGMVGEGEGWWGWALIVLALSAMFLTLR